MTAATTCDDDATFAEYLQTYGWMLALPGGWRLLAGFLRGDQLQYARSVIEAKYPPAAPALTVLDYKRERKAAAPARLRAA